MRILIAMVTIVAVGQDGKESFDALEKTLLEAKTVRFKSKLETEGVVTASFEGELVAASGNKVNLKFDGKYGKKEAKAQLVADGKEMFHASADAASRSDCPDKLNEGIVLGVTRMGTMHNIYKVSNGMEPDGTDGKAREWVTVSGFRNFKEEVVEKVDAVSFEFDITVGGEKRAHATLWLNKKTGLPIKRFQTVQFGDKTMKGTEVFSEFEIDKKVDHTVFRLPEDY